MKNTLLLGLNIILMVFYAGLNNRTAAQGIRNEGATIIVASGCHVVCQGGFNNSSGTVTNDGTLTITGGIINAALMTIEGDGSYNIGGNLVNNGTFAQTAGTTTFNGTGTQTISGSSLTTFNNLIIDGTSAGTTIAAGAMVTVAGNTFSPNGKLTINSDAVDNSGSLIYTGSGTPSGDVTYNRIMPADRYRYVSSPVSATLLPVGTTFWRWNEPLGVWGEDINETPTTSCQSGMGYTMLTSGNMVSFTGSVINSAIQTGTAPYSTPYTQERTTWGGGGWNLLGNPFTSAMDGLLFINSNMSSFDPSYQALYIYNGTDYYYIAPATSGYPGLGMFSGTDVQAGQGFFVLAHHDGVEFNFNGGIRKHNTSAVMTKAAGNNEIWPGLQLKIKHGNKEHSALIVYNEQMTPGLDPGFDIGLLSTGLEMEIYTVLAEKENDVNFTRQALPVEGADKIIIPVGLDSEKGGEVTFSAYTVPLGLYKFWLEDRTTGIFTDLNVNTYNVSLPAKTYGTGRFFIYASANSPTGIDSPAVDLNQDIRIWNSGDRAIIKGDVSERAICEIYDLKGEIVLLNRLTEGELNIVDLSSISRGVCLVRVIDGMKVFTRKIVLL